MTTCQRIVLASRPQGWVTPENFRLEAVEVPTPGPGQLLVRNHYLSLDPYMRGRMVDRKGKAASIMFLGSAMLIAVHFLFAIPLLSHWLVAFVLMLVLGVAFSLVPSAMWPSVPKLIPEKQLGTAYALIFYIQNWGLMGVPLLIGWILDRYCIVSRTVAADGSPLVAYNYTIPMLVFMGFGILGLIFAFLLKAEDKRKGYGLELPSSTT